MDNATSWLAARFEREAGTFLGFGSTSFQPGTIRDCLGGFTGQDWEGRRESFHLAGARTVEFIFEGGSSGDLRSQCPSGTGVSPVGPHGQDALSEANGMPMPQVEGTSLARPPARPGCCLRHYIDPIK